MDFAQAAPGTREACAVRRASSAAATATNEKNEEELKVASLPTEQSAKQELAGEGRANRCGALSGAADSTTTTTAREGAPPPADPAGDDGLHAEPRRSGRSVSDSPAADGVARALANAKPFDGSDIPRACDTSDERSRHAAAAGSGADAPANTQPTDAAAHAKVHQVGQDEREMQSASAGGAQDGAENKSDNIAGADDLRERRRQRKQSAVAAAQAAGGRDFIFAELAPISAPTQATGADKISGEEGGDGEQEEQEEGGTRKEASCNLCNYLRASTKPSGASAVCSQESSRADANRAAAAADLGAIEASQEIDRLERGATTDKTARLVSRDAGTLVDCDSGRRQEPPEGQSEEQVESAEGRRREQPQSCDQQLPRIASASNDHSEFDGSQSVVSQAAPPPRRRKRATVIRGLSLDGNKRQQPLRSAGRGFKTSDCQLGQSRSAPRKTCGSASRLSAHSSSGSLAAGRVLVISSDNVSYAIQSKYCTSAGSFGAPR